MRGRLIAIGLIAAALAPGTWLRTPLPEPDHSQVLRLTPLETGQLDLGEVQFKRAWRLNSPNTHFGSYSALIIDKNGRFLAGSDHGRLLRFDIPGSRTRARAPELRQFPGIGNADKFSVDLESLTRDAATSRIWAGFEGRNAIVRVSRDMTQRRLVEPAAMREWSSNSGPESLVRLEDGRFIVISEGTDPAGGALFPVLLFAGDPTEAATARHFRFRPPEGYRPVDATQLPDGRLLVLVRNFTIALPPRFAVKLVVADPDDLDPARPWQGREIAAIDDPAIADNYEGVAVQDEGDGSLTIWLISDDNNAIYQRTLLLELRWNPSR